MFENILSLQNHYYLFPQYKYPLYYRSQFPSYSYWKVYFRYNKFCRYDCRSSYILKMVTIEFKAETECTQELF